MTAGQHDRRYAALRRSVDTYLNSVLRAGDPADLSGACRYVLSGGGKRLRAVLCLLSCEAVGGTARQALHAGAAIEIMHNFTLVHDDIMDNAPSRRGRPSVHVRWDLNNALLVGDILLGIAYRQLLLTSTPHIHRILSLFTTGVIEVCKGQALDLAYGRRSDVTVNQYFHMIEQKTGRLISLATEMGGILGGGEPSEIAALRKFGHALGRAFQLQDDLLDVVADERTFGKIIGGDIMEGKRTFLLLSATERTRGKDRRLLRRVLQKRGRGVGPRRTIVPAVTALYRRSGALAEADRLIERNTNRAVAALKDLRPSSAGETLAWLANALVHRSS